ncbi:MAG: hypothetical protein AAF416_18695 [Pseudomonadota bacterium]
MVEMSMSNYRETLKAEDLDARWAKFSRRYREIPGGFVPLEIRGLNYYAFRVASGAHAPRFEFLSDRDEVEREHDACCALLLEIVEHLQLERPPKRFRRVPDWYAGCARSIRDLLFAFDGDELTAVWRSHQYLLFLLIQVIEINRIAQNKKSVDLFDENIFISSLFNAFLFDITLKDWKVKGRYRKREDLPRPDLPASHRSNQERADLGVRLPPAVRDVFDKCAEKRGMNRTEWVLRALLREAANEGFDVSELEALPPGRRRRRSTTDVSLKDDEAADKGPSVG